MATGKLEGKVAIITGAGQGIGRGIALAFVKEGAKLVAAGRTQAKLDAVVEELRQLGGTAIAVRCDVGVEEDVKRTVELTVREFGTVDILVNCAQSWGPKGQRMEITPYVPLEEFPEDCWDNMFQTGVKAVFYFCKAVYPHMKGRGGKIINFASYHGLVGYPLTVDYNANKEAIRALTRTAAREWGKYKINVNVVCPKAMTPAVETFRREQPERYREQVAKVPLGYYGDTERDIGRAVVFLASQDADFITGQTVQVDGGAYMFP